MKRQVDVGMAHSTGLGLITIMLDSSQNNHSVPRLGIRARRRLRPDKIKAAYKAAANPNNKHAQYLLSELYWRQIYNLSCSHPHFVVDLWKEVLVTQGPDLARKLIDDILCDDLWCRDKTAAILYTDRGEWTLLSPSSAYNGDFDGRSPATASYDANSPYFPCRTRAETRAEVAVCAKLKAALCATGIRFPPTDRGRVSLTTEPTDRPTGRRDVSVARPITISARRWIKAITSHLSSSTTRPTASELDEWFAKMRDCDSGESVRQSAYRRFDQFGCSTMAPLAEAAVNAAGLVCKHSSSRRPGLFMFARCSEPVTKESWQAGQRRHTTGTQPDDKKTLIETRGRRLVVRLARGLYISHGVRIPQPRLV